jgi:hypothetical protein
MNAAHANSISATRFERIIRKCRIDMPIYNQVFPSKQRTTASSLGSLEDIYCTLTPPATEGHLLHGTCTLHWFVQQ